VTVKLGSQKFLCLFFFSVFLLFPFSSRTAASEALLSEVGRQIGTILFPENQKFKPEKISESWMGVYMERIKVGYSVSQVFSLMRNGQRTKKVLDKLWMRVSRLGGNPVELSTTQESFYDAHGRPLESILRTKMSESETVIKAEIGRDKIMFKSGDKIIKELIHKEEVYFGTPIEKIIAENGLRPGHKYTFKILDFTTYSLADTQFEVVGRENVLILGKRLNLWHIQEKTNTVIPISVDEWIDEKGNSLKSVSRIGFVNLTAIQMPKERAQEISEENFDIAFSTVIESNITFENPQEVQVVKFKLSGIPLERIKSLPFDEKSQKILELEKDYAIIQTSSQIFKEEEALSLPIEKEEFQGFLKTTTFCQSDDPEIKKTAEEIIGEEKNSWRAAKKIAEWVRRKMTSTYDVGFADAREVLRNREGDCSEHTVLTVALLRAAGIPARAAVGIMYGEGIFAYHMWPEIYVGRWIGLDARWLAIDKKTGEYYTDATHIKLGQSLLDENIYREMAQAISEFIGKLRLEIVDYYQDR
jgi:hypothetical protein